MTPEDQIRTLEKHFRSVWLRLPAILGNAAVNFTLDNFRRQGFLNYGLERWPQRKEGWRKKRNGAILIKSGTLRRSIRVIYTAIDSVTIGSDVPYAKAHNEGLRLGIIQSVKGFKRKNGSDVKDHTRRINQNIPKRQYMGDSPSLRAVLKRTATAEFMKEISYLKP